MSRTCFTPAEGEDHPRETAGDDVLQALLRLLHSMGGESVTLP